MLQKEFEFKKLGVQSIFIELCDNRDDVIRDPESEFYFVAIEDLKCDTKLIFGDQLFEVLLSFLCFFSNLVCVV